MFKIILAILLAIFASISPVEAGELGTTAVETVVVESAFEVTNVIDDIGLTHPIIPPPTRRRILFLFSPTRRNRKRLRRIFGRRTIWFSESGNLFSLSRGVPHANRYFIGKDDKRREVSRTVYHEYRWARTRGNARKRRRMRGGLSQSTFDTKTNAEANRLLAEIKANAEARAEAKAEAKAKFVADVKFVAILLTICAAHLLQLRFELGSLQTDGSEYIAAAIGPIIGLAPRPDEKPDAKPSAWVKFTLCWKQELKNEPEITASCEFNINLHDPHQAVRILYRVLQYCNQNKDAKSGRFYLGKVDAKQGPDVVDKCYTRAGMSGSWHAQAESLKELITQLKAHVSVSVLKESGGLRLGVPNHACSMTPDGEMLQTSWLEVADDLAKQSSTVVEPGFQVGTICLRNETIVDALKKAGMLLFNAKKAFKRLSSLGAEARIVMSGYEIVHDATLDKYDGFIIVYSESVPEGKMVFTQPRGYHLGTGFKGLAICLHGKKRQVVTGSENLKGGLLGNGTGFMIEQLLGKMEEQFKCENRGARRGAKLPLMMILQFANLFLREERDWFVIATEATAKGRQEALGKKLAAGGTFGIESDRDAVAEVMTKCGVLTSALNCMMEPFVKYIENFGKKQIHEADSKKSQAGNLKEMGIDCPESGNGIYVPLGMVIRAFEIGGQPEMVERFKNSTTERLEERDGNTINDLEIVNGAVDYSVTINGKTFKNGIHAIDSNLLEGFPNGVLFISDAWVIVILPLQGGADTDGDRTEFFKTIGRALGFTSTKDGGLKKKDIRNPMMFFRNPVGGGEVVFVDPWSVLVGLKSLRNLRGDGNVPAMRTPKFKKCKFYEVPEECFQEFDNRPWDKKASRDLIEIRLAAMVYLGQLINYNNAAFMLAGDDEEVFLFPSEATIDAIQQELASKEFYAWAKLILENDTKMFSTTAWLRYGGTDLEKLDKSLDDNCFFHYFMQKRSAAWLRARKELLAAWTDPKNIIERRHRALEELCGNFREFAMANQIIDALPAYQNLVATEGTVELWNSLLTSIGMRYKNGSTELVTYFSKEIEPERSDAWHRAFSTVLLWTAITKRSYAQIEWGAKNVKGMANDLRILGYSERTVTVRHPFIQAITVLRGGEVVEVAKSHDFEVEGEFGIDIPDYLDNGTGEPVNPFDGEPEDFENPFDGEPEDFENPFDGDGEDFENPFDGDGEDNDDDDDPTPPPAPAAKKEPEVNSANPLVAAGVKPEDKSGHCAKDIAMAEIATQFIGMEVAHSNNSSTKKYRLAWGDRANTNCHRTDDIVMVSGSGDWGRVTREDCEKVFIEHYVMHLMAACIAKCKFVVGNARGVDQMVRVFLLSQGYIEHPRDGFGLFSLRTMFDPKDSDIVVDIDDYRNGGVDDEVVINKGSDSDHHGLEDSDPVEVEVESSNGEMDVSTFSPDQKVANDGLLTTLFTNGEPIAILNGAAGTGKTHLMGHLIEFLTNEFRRKESVRDEHGQSYEVDKPMYNISCLAPTRKAKGRLAEALFEAGATEFTAKTVHQFLTCDTAHGHLYPRSWGDLIDWIKSRGGFENLTDSDVDMESLSQEEKIAIGYAEMVQEYEMTRQIIVVDEASMISDSMWIKLLERLQHGYKGSKMILLGDIVQLPPVMSDPFGKLKRGQRPVDEDTGKELTQEQIDLVRMKCISKALIDGYASSPLELEDIPRFELTTNWRQKDGPGILRVVDFMREKFLSGFSWGDRTKNGISTVNDADFSHKLDAIIDEEHEAFKMCEAEEAAEVCISNPGESIGIFYRTDEVNAFNDQCLQETKPGVDELSMWRGDNPFAAGQVLVVNDTGVLAGPAKLATENGAGTEGVSNGDRLIIKKCGWLEKCVQPDEGHGYQAWLAELAVCFDDDKRPEPKIYYLYIRVNCAPKNAKRDKTSWWFERVQPQTRRIGEKQVINPRAFLKTDEKTGKLLGKFVGNVNTECELNRIAAFSASVSWGWGLTVHKSQGSGYETICMSRETLNMTERYRGRGDIIKGNLRLAYTAATRAKKKVFLVDGLI